NVEESIDLFRGYYPKPRPTDEILEVVGLTEQRGQRVRRLSGGQQRRLDVAIGLAGDPELLFLDEPTTGFDPSARRQAWEMVRSLRALGKTVLLTTHYMDEAEHLADRVAMIVAGEIVALGTPAELISRIGEATISFSVPAGEAGALADLLEGIGGAEVEGATARVRVKEPTVTLHEITARALQSGTALLELAVERPTLEDAYLALAGSDAGSTIRPLAGGDEDRGGQ
ncbi:MAG: ATP-binding cassette domain-containing protein, partial [Dehalococcoidia bacterium]